MSVYAGIKADGLFNYQPPVNLLALFILVPIRIVVVSSTFLLQVYTDGLSRVRGHFTQSTSFAPDFFQVEHLREYGCACF